MTWSSATSDADPGAGKIAFNNGTLGSVSILYVDDADDASADISSYVQSWDDVSNGVARGIVTVTKEGTASTYATFKVTGAVTNATGYTKVPVTHVVSSGTFSNTDGVGVHFSYSGVDGTGNVSTDGVQTLTNKTLTLPKINEDVTTTSTSTELNKLDALSRGSIIYGNASAATAVLTKGGAATVLTSDGTDISWEAVAGRTGAVSWCTTAKTSPLTAASAKGYFINTTGGAVTVTLPSSPSAGDIVAVKDYAGTFASNNLTIGNNSSKINGVCGNDSLSTNKESMTLVYVDGTKGWLTVQETSTDVQGSQLIAASGGTILTVGDFKTHVFTGDGTFCVSAGAGPLAIADYVVVAGGASGGRGRGGGGGAGGFRLSNSYGISAPTMSPLSNPSGLTLSPGAYTITVGGGGAVTNTGTPSSGNSGTVSVFSTINSAGGGGGSAATACDAESGGSGGGVGYVGPGSPGSAGAGNTPPVSPPQGNAGGTTTATGSGVPTPQRAGGAGGGAGAVGGNSSPGTFGVGGIGSFVADSFFGPTAPSYGTPGPVSSARYFAGGGGSGGQLGAGGAGGAGGGGAGKGTTASVAGTVNTGGASGGSGEASCSTTGTGGSGIVMIRYKFQ
jgi:hypothetical protein